MDFQIIFKFAEIFYKAATLSTDQLELIKIFNHYGVKYVVIGGSVLGQHGVRDASNDLDIFVEPSKQNSGLIYESLVDFGIPVKLWNVTPKTFVNTPEGRAQNLRAGNIEVIADINEIPISFEQAYRYAEDVEINGVPIKYMSLQGIANMKQHSDREKDLQDLELLREMGIHPEKLEETKVANQSFIQRA